MAGQPGSRDRCGLAPDRLGVSGLLFFVLGAAAPLASTAGGTSTGWAVTGVTGIPIAFFWSRRCCCWFSSAATPR